MPAYHDVMANLNEIINLRSLTDDRIAQGTPVDRAVGADFHPVLDDDTADLADLQMALAAHGEAEAVLADRHARMDDHIIADQGVGDHSTRADEAVPPDGAAITDDGAGGDARARAYLGLGADDRARLDGDTRFQAGAGVDMSGIRWGASSRLRGARFRIEERERFRIGAVGLRRQQHRRCGGSARGVLGLDEAGAGPGLRELRQIFRIVEKGDIGGAGRIERADVRHEGGGTAWVGEFGSAFRGDPRE